MRYTNLKIGSATIRTSVLGFGCSAILGRSGTRDSMHALATAWDHGINVFDTARSYGYGDSESLLGKFLRGRRSEAIISTKFGILPARQQPWKQALKPIARHLLTVVPSMRRAIRGQVQAQFQPGMFSVDVLQQSIEESLRKLGTDYVDILFMHDAPASVLTQDELLAAIDGLIRSGKIRAAGISARPDVIRTALTRMPRMLSAAQFPCNLLDLSIADDIGKSHSSALFFSNHPFGGVEGVAKTRLALEQIKNWKDTPELIRDKLENTTDSLLADVVLNVITQEKSIDVVLTAMMRPSHIVTNAEAIASSIFTEEELAWLRANIAAAQA